MSPARYGQWLLGSFRCKHRRLEFFDALRPEDAVNARAIELRVDVIHCRGIVYRSESQSRTEVESCRSGEELTSIDQLTNSPGFGVSRDARTDHEPCDGLENMVKRIVIEVLGMIPTVAGCAATAKATVKTSRNPIRKAGASVLRSATPGTMRIRDCLFLGKLDPNGGLREGPLAFAADDKEAGSLELSLLG